MARARSCPESSEGRSSLSRLQAEGKSIDDAQLRKFTKRTVDYGSDVVRWMEA